MIERRRALRAVFAGSAAALIAPGLLHAQRAGPPARVGMLTLAGRASISAIIDDFRAALAELGHVEGRSYVFDLQSAEGQVERLPELAARLVAQRADVIVTGGGNVSAKAARQATTTIPIVMTSALGPVEAGLVQSLARPGANVTGVYLPQELGMKQLQVLRELVPSLTRVAVITRADPAQAAARTDAVAMVQQFLQMNLSFVELRTPDDLPQALRQLRELKVQALLVTPDPLVYQLREALLQFARANRLPDLHPIAELVDSGGLISLGPSPQEVAHMITRIVDRVLKGARPADIPMEQPTRYEMVINLRTAKALGLTVPQALLLRAERVVE